MFYSVPSSLVPLSTATLWVFVQLNIKYERAHGRERERKRGLLAAWSIGTDSVCFHRGNGVGYFGGENRIHMRKRENEPFLNETL